MTEPTQTTIYGAQEPLQAPVPHRSPEYVAVPLFAAPDAMRGQLHMPTDTPSERHAAARCARLRPRSEDLPAYVERTTT